MEALAVLGAAWPRLMTELHGRRLADGTSHGDVSGVRGEDWSSVISAVWIALGMLPVLLLALDAMRKQTDTRFLVITHNPVTMARMDRLFGVTMGERGVSQLVSVNLTRAEEMLAAE